MFFVKRSHTTKVCNTSMVIYKTLWGNGLMVKKRTETAQKAGEDRAILLGLGMVFISVMMHFVICITMVRAYADKKCYVMTALIIFSYTYMNSSLNIIKQITHGFVFPQCFYVPKCQKECYDPEHFGAGDSSEHQGSVCLHSLFWPSCMLSGGTFITLMVKLTQYLSILCEQIGKAPK
ncbi:calcium-activated potassium channel subunit beta-2-like [Cyprinus carpio]|uniref:Calcium-activated potassium channel subunit beta-2-like n=1 Tax=Cyprinus carpio TaxID=7962 RepID=A0A9Q9W1U4_CYPCA|nr:calcium-activated potassium channel subunit beta-2-like [Cyprinus carpio]